MLSLARRSTSLCGLADLPAAGYERLAEALPEEAERLSKTPFAIIQVQACCAGRSLWLQASEYPVLLLQFWQSTSGPVASAPLGEAGNPLLFLCLLELTPATSAQASRMPRQWGLKTSSPCR